MNELFKSFNNGNKKVTSKDGSMSANITFHGSFTIEKGGLSQDISFYASVSGMQYKGYVALEDWEINDRMGASFNGLPIDSVCDLKSTLRSSGLSTVAESLDISEKEEERQLALQVSKDKIFKKVFGKDAILWCTLSEDERSIIQLSAQIEKGEESYDKLNASCYFLKRFVTIDEDDNQVKPTFEELIVIVDELKLSQVILDSIEQHKSNEKE